MDNLEHFYKYNKQGMSGEWHVIFHDDTIEYISKSLDEFIEEWRKRRKLAMEDKVSLYKTTKHKNDDEIDIEQISEEEALTV